MEYITIIKNDKYCFDISMIIRLLFRLVEFLKISETPSATTTICFLLAKSVAGWSFSFRRGWLVFRTPNLYALAPGSIDGRAVNDGESKRHVSDISIPMRRSVKGCAIKEPPCIIKKHQKIGVEGNFLKHFLMVSNFSRCFFLPSVFWTVTRYEKNTLKNQRELTEKSEPYLYYILVPLQLIIW